MQNLGTSIIIFLAIMGFIFPIVMLVWLNFIAIKARIEAKKSAQEIYEKYSKKN